MNFQTLAWGYNILPHIIGGSSSKLLFSYMCMMADAENQVRLESKSLGLLLSLSKSTMSRALNSLENQGIISKVKRGNKHTESTYVVNSQSVKMTPRQEGQSVKMSLLEYDALFQGVKMTLIKPPVKEKEERKPLEKKEEKEKEKKDIKEKTYKNKSKRKKKEDLPKWCQVLLRDDRLKIESVTPDWIERIETTYADKDLLLEAENCVDWISNKPEAKSVKATFNTWLSYEKRWGKGANPKQSTFNAHSGGNMASILEFANQRKRK